MILKCIELANVFFFFLRRIVLCADRGKFQKAFATIWLKNQHIFKQHKNVTENVSLSYHFDLKIVLRFYCLANN